jgi:hypothetical protein
MLLRAAGVCRKNAALHCTKLLIFIRMDFAPVWHTRIVELGLAHGLFPFSQPPAYVERVELSTKCGMWHKFTLNHFVSTAGRSFSYATGLAGETLSSAVDQV